MSNDSISNREDIVFQKCDNISIINVKLKKLGDNITTPNRQHCIIYSITFIFAYKNFRQALEWRKLIIWKLFTQLWFLHNGSCKNEIFANWTFRNCNFCWWKLSKLWYNISCKFLHSIYFSRISLSVNRNSFISSNKLRHLGYEIN